MVSTRTILLTLGLATILSGGTRREIWHLDLTAALRKGDTPSSRYPIYAVRFSPDGRQLAVVSGKYEQPSGRILSRMFIVDVKNPAPPGTWFDVSWGINDSEVGGRRSGFQWAPTGKMIIADRDLIDIATGSKCHIPDLSWFVSDDQLIGFAAPFRIFDTSCHEVGRAKFDSQAYILDTAPDSQVVLLSLPRHHAYPEVDCLVSNPFTTDVIHRWTHGDGGCPGFRFAAGGRALCSQHGLGDGPTFPVTCIDTRSDVVIGKPGAINGGLPIATANLSTRIVGSDLRRVFRFTDESGVRLEARVVWDFQTGEEIARWSPKAQKFETDVAGKSPRSDQDVFRFDISPDGKYVAEGGNGWVYLYELQP